MNRAIVLDHPEFVGRWVAKRTGGTWTPVSQAIGLMDTSNPDVPRLIAGVLYDGWNGSSINIHVAADTAYEKRWLNRAFLYAAFAFPFKQLGALRLNGIVAADNIQAQRFDEALGFVHEATLERAGPKGVDLFIYRMFREDCRWLNLNKEYAHGRKVVHA